MNSKTMCYSCGGTGCEFQGYDITDYVCRDCGGTGKCIHPSAPKSINRKHKRRAYKLTNIMPQDKGGSK